MDKNTSWTVREPCQMEEKALSKDRVSFVECSVLCRCGACASVKLFYVLDMQLLKKTLISIINTSEASHLLSKYFKCFWMDFVLIKPNVKRQR